MVRTYADDTHFFWEHTDFRFRQSAGHDYGGQCLQVAQAILCAANGWSRDYQAPYQGASGDRPLSRGFKFFMPGLISMAAASSRLQVHCISQRLAAGAFHENVFAI